MLTLPPGVDSPVTVRIAYGADLTAAPASWPWVDYTLDVRGKVQIRRGKRPGAQRVEPARCVLLLASDDGRHHPLLVAGANYPDVRRNTPIEVLLHDSIDASTPVRFGGFIDSFTPVWPAGDDELAYVAIDCNGILGRLGQGTRPFKTAAQRAILATGAVEYWILNDGFDATFGGSATGGHRMDVMTGTTVTWAQFTDSLAAGLSTPDMSAGSLTGLISGVSATAWHAEMWLRVDTYSSAAAVRLYAGTGTTHAVWRFFLPNADPDNVTVFVGGIDDAVDFALSGPSWTAAQFLTVWHHYAVTAEQVGADVRAKLYVDGVQVDSVDVTGTLQAPDRILVGHNIGALTSAAHIAIGNGTTISDAVNAVDGYRGETAAARVARLCAEEGIPVEVEAGQSQAMGPQPTATFLAILAECESTDVGVLAEEPFGLRYIPRGARYNQAPALRLDTAQGSVKLPFTPVYDDRDLRNDVEARRPGGSSARYEATGVLAPGSSTGRYDIPATVNPDTDAPLNEIAAWLAHLGTVDEYRIPALSWDLATHPELIPAWLAADVTSRLVAEHELRQFPPMPVDQLIDGWTETFAAGPIWTVEGNGSPAVPWEVWQMDSGGSTLVTARNTSDTSYKLATSVGPAWSTTGEPYYLQVAGEAFQVTAITTDTAAFIAAGTASTANGANTTPGLPAGITADVGQVLLLAAYTDAAAGTVDLPSGFLPIGVNGNLALFGRYYVTGVVAPTVTYTGDAAGDINIAQIAGFSGLSLHLDGGRYRLGTGSPQVATNASSGNITTPALSVRRDNCVVIIVGSRTEDWVSVAPLAGFTEIGEPDDGTGNRAGMVWDYQIQTTATDIAASAFVCTGGSGGTGKSLAVALRPLQTATVVRAVNRVSVSPAAGDPVHGWRAGVLAL